MAGDGRDRAAAVGRTGSPADTGPRRRRPLRAVVIEDEAPISRLVATYLEDDGFEVAAAADGETGVELVRTREPDVVVLDLMLPGMDGVEVCRTLRTFSDAYVLMLTARTEEIDKVIGLSVGADDYVTKPFSPRELVARVRALLRRPRSARREAEPPRRFGDLVIDTAAREAFLGGQQLDLTRTEFEVLAELSAHPRVVLSKEQLLENVWGADWFGDDHVVEVHVGNLRRKLGDDPRAPRYIRTVRGVGYRMGSGT